MRVMLELIRERSKVFSADICELISVLGVSKNRINILSSGLKDNL